MDIVFIASLMLLGIVLILLEIFIIPGVGVAGFIGLASLIGSSVYTFYVYESQIPGIIVTVVNAVMMVVFLVYCLRAKTWKRFQLDEVIDSKTNTEGSSVKVGDAGKTVSRLAPMGSARFGTVTCEVRSEEGIIDAGTDIVVARTEPGKIFVNKA